jgi:Flp pilus assembly protein TadD
MTGGGSARWRTVAPWGREDAIWIGALAALTLAVYYRVVLAQFLVYDDPLYITQNPVVQAGLTEEGVRLAFTRFHASNWHPLTWLSHMLDVEFFGLDPRGHHAVNLVLHAANSGLLYLALRSLTGSTAPSALVAALFAVHPLHVESVAWVAERKDLLCGFFWMLTLLAYARYARAPGARTYAPVVILFALCLMAKPMGVTLPLVLLLLDFWPLGRVGQGTPGWRRLVLEKAPLFALSALSSAVTYLAQATAGAVTSLERIPFASRAANAVLSYWGYLGKALWPAKLSVFYPHREPGLGDPSVILGAAGLAAVTVAAWRRRGREPYLLAGWLWFLVTLLPVIGLVQVGEHAMADRYTYIPLVGPFLALGWGAKDLACSWPASRGPQRWFAVLTVALLGVATWRQTTYWRDSEALFSRALRVTEGNWLAHNNYGVALFRQGSPKEAVEHFAQVVRLRPRSAEARVNLAAVLRNLGRREEAVESYLEALAIEPGNTKAHNGLGLLYESLGRDREAAAEYEEAIRAGDGRVAVRRRLGALLVRQGRLEEARLHLAEVVRQLPDDPDARYALGVVLEREGRSGEAEAQLREALRLRPEHGAARHRLEVLGDGIGRGQSTDASGEPLR